MLKRSVEEVESFILTKWYVKNNNSEGIKKEQNDFILTKWYLNNCTLAAIAKKERVLY